MPTPFESALLNLRLFELRREPVLREARGWFLRDFNPETLAELAALASGERNSSFRMVLGYWDLAASLVTTGAVDAESFRAAHSEIFAVFGKISPLLSELRAASGEPDFCKHIEAVVMSAPDAESILTRRREALRLARQAEASKTRTDSTAYEGTPMDPTIAGLRTVIVRELNAFIREVEMFPDDALLWQTVPGVTNSAGNLVLHITGNLQHFIGHVLGGTGYVRNRDDEFGRRSGTRAWLAAELNRTIEIVSKVLPQVTGETLAREYPERIADLSINARAFLTHLSVHLAYHLGQAGYLRRVLTGENRSSSPLPLAPLAGMTHD